MGKIYTQTINRFDGGISNDLRVLENTITYSANKYGLLRNFDPFTYAHKLVPRGAVVDTDIDGLDLEIFRIFRLNYCYSDATHYYLFAIGKQTANDYAIVLYWDTATSLWVSAALSSAGFPDEDTFFYYKDYLYWFTDGVKLQRLKTDMLVDLDESYRSFTAGLSYHCQPVHHKLDDCAYFFLNNQVFRATDTSTWETGSGADGAVLELPSDGYIYAACQYGNFLALGWSSLDNTKSIIFLWDRSSTLNTLSERYDLGFGKVIHLFSSGGTLKAVISSFPKIIVKQLYGGILTTVSELVSDSTGTAFETFSTDGLLLDDRYYFTMDLDGDNGDRSGVWVVDVKGNITMDYAIDGAETYEAVHSDGSNFWIAHDTGVVSKISFNNYINTETGIYESLLFGSADKTYKLLSVCVMTAPLPATGEVILKYRKDEDLDGSWTQIFKNSAVTTGSFRVGEKYKITVVGDTDFTLIGASANTVGVVFTATGVGGGTTGTAVPDLMGHEAINIESTGVTLPTYQEIQFRIESEGGAVITGLTFEL